MRPIGLVLALLLTVAPLATEGQQPEIQRGMSLTGGR